jgi:hypothetical protein
MPMITTALGYSYAPNWKTDTNLRECFVNKYLAQEGFEAKGIRASDVCYIASIDRDADRLRRLNPDAAPEMQPAVVCTAYGWLAAQRVGEGSHRLATEAEIAKYHEDMKAREQWCRDQTLASQKQAAIIHSMAYVEAVKSLGPNLSGKAKKD